MYVRHIITFENLHQVLQAERLLKNARDGQFEIRPTPTPPGLSSAICGMSIEILRSEQAAEILSFLQKSSLEPAGVYELNS